jgi:hypothetical protein
MEKIIITCFLFLVFCNSYSQQKEDTIKMFPISENYETQNDCEIINFPHSSFVLYVCSREKNIYNSLIPDTLIVVVELKIQFCFTDTSTYFTIKEINKLTPAVILSDREKEKKFINKIIIQMMQNSRFYYKGRKDEFEISYYLNFPLKFIPCIKY